MNYPASRVWPRDECCPKGARTDCRCAPGDYRAAPFPGAGCLALADALRLCGFAARIEVDACNLEETTMRTIVTALLLTLSNPLLAGSKDSAEFDGSCAWGLAEYGAIVPTDCSINWIDPKTSKTYCFSSEKSKQSFLQNPDENERRAAEKGRKLQKVH
jgi:hypothetical protein